METIFCRYSHSLGSENMYELNFSETYQNFSEEEKLSFQKAVTKLLSCTYLNRNRAELTDWDENYLFIERNFGTVSAYFDYAGFSLELHDNIQVISLTSKFSSARKKLDKETSLFALTLRLLYAERQHTFTTTDRIVIRNSEFLDKLFEYGVRNRKPNLQQMGKTLRSLANIGIVHKLKGKWEDPDTSFIIYPAIFLLLPEHRLDQHLELLEKAEKENVRHD